MTLDMDGVRLEADNGELNVVDYTGFKPNFNKCSFFGGGSSGPSNALVYGNTSGDNADLGYINNCFFANRDPSTYYLYLKGENMHAHNNFYNVVSTGVTDVIYVNSSLYSALGDQEVYLQGSSNPTNLLMCGGYYGTNVSSLFCTHDSPSTYYTGSMVAASTQGGVINIGRLGDSLQYATTIFADAATADRCIVGVLEKRFMGQSGSSRTYVPGASPGTEDATHAVRGIVNVTHFTKIRVHGQATVTNAGTKGLLAYNETNAAALATKTFTSTSATYIDSDWTDITALSGVKEISLKAYTPSAGQTWTWGTSSTMFLQLAGWR